MSESPPTWTIAEPDAALPHRMAEYIAMLDNVARFWPFAQGRAENLEFNQVPTLAAELAAWLRLAY